jgi:polyisoprenoid-binding protein YceI
MALLRLLAAIAALVADGAPAPADAPRTFSATRGSTIAYHLNHPFHAVDGRSSGVEGRVRLLPDGGVQVVVRARVDSFDSGNSNRDAHMMEVTEAARFPFVTFKGVAAGVRVEGVPTELELPLRGTLEFHGVSREVAVVAKVRFPSPDRAEAEATFPISLGEHGVKRPSLVFVQVEDRIQITAHLSLALEAP